MMKFNDFLWQNLQLQKEGSEQIFNGFFQNSMVGQVVVFSSGSMAANGAFCQMLGYSEEELGKKHWQELTHPDDLAGAIKEMQKMVSGEKTSVRLLLRYLRKDGSIVWAEHYATLCHAPAEFAPYFLSTIIDVSLRVQYEEELEQTKQMLMTFLDASEDKIIIKDENLKYLLVNQAVADYYGKTKSELQGLRDSDLLSAEEALRTRTIDQEVLRQHTLIHAEERLAEKVYEIRKFPVTFSHEKIGVGAYIRDITEIAARAKELNTMIIRTKAMYANHDAIIMALEIDNGQIIEVNPAAERFFGYTLAEFQQMKIDEINILGQEESNRLLRLAAERKQSKLTSSYRLKNGTVRIVESYSCPVPFEDRMVLFSIMFDVTQREEAAEQIQYLANHDYLTGIYNRRYFYETFHKLASGKQDYPLGVIMGDMNGLKLYNDTYGHARGDAALKELVERMQRCLPEKVCLARIGGDEFAMLLTQTNEAEMRSMLDHLEQELDIFNNTAASSSVSISFGYSIQRKCEDDLDALLKEAEAFMYNRKYYSARSSRSSAVHVILETLFSKSERDKYHSERVSQLCEAIAKAMQLDKETVDKIRVAGLLHDIGKIGIDESILNKADKLNASEWEIMKLHSAKGAKILGNTIEFNDIADWVLAHHECYDGTGYPNKLKGDRIPLAARIIAVADAFDAMTNERAYRNAMSTEQAIHELKQQTGTQLDPEILRIFLETVPMDEP